MSQFGKVRIKDFLMDPQYINTNHGSYGYVPKVVMQQKKRLEQQCEFNTEKWFRVDLEKKINQVREIVAKRVKCPTKNLFIIQNATDGINCVLKSLKWTSDDVILLPNTAYASIRNTAYRVRDMFGVTILDLNFTVQDFKTPQSIQLKVQNFVNSYPKKITVAVLDHVISTPAMVLPIQSLQLFFDQKKIPLFIDGAHAFNMLDINISELQPQAYFSNFHKWAYVPKNAAFLYISDEYLDIIQPVVTGNFNYETVQRRFFWTGTRDLTASLCIKKALQYSDSFGNRAVQNYNKALVIAGAKKMAQVWGTRLLTQDPRCIGFLANVLVPSSDIAVCVQIANEMMEKDNMYPIFFKFDGKVWCRICAQIYNQLSDYQKTALTFMKRLKERKAAQQ